jgi:hypothetical protein
MRHKLSAAHLRAVRGAAAHCFGDHAHGHALQPRQNVAPEVHAIERSVIAPRVGSFALLRGGRSPTALHFSRLRGIVACCAHRSDLGRASSLESRDRRAPRRL